MTLLVWVFANKLLIFLITATTVFGISTIALGVQKSNLTDDLEECREAQATTTTASSATPTTTTTTTEAPTDPNEDMSKYRLPSGVVPKSYDLFLYPYLDTGKFEGEVTITLDVTEARTFVVLHNNQLNITKVAIDGNDGTFEVDEKYERLTVYAENQQKIEAGERLLKINFDGDMTNRIVGLYKSTYVNENSNTR